MHKQVINFRFSRLDPDNARIYYRGCPRSSAPNDLFCLQPGDGDVPELLHCTIPLGEPEYPVDSGRIGRIEFPKNADIYERNMARWVIFNQARLNNASERTNKHAGQSRATDLEWLFFNRREDFKAPRWSEFKGIVVRDFTPPKTGAAEQSDTLGSARRMVEFYTIYGVRRNEEEEEAITDCRSRSDALAIQNLFLAFFVD